MIAFSRCYRRYCSLAVGVETTKGTVSKDPSAMERAEAHSYRLRLGLVGKSVDVATMFSPAEDRRALPGYSLTAASRHTMTYLVLC